MKKFECGCLFDDTLSKNNYDFSTLRKASKADSAIEFPIEYKRDYKIYRQDGGKCVAFSLANNRRFSENLQTNIKDDYSHDFIYANRLDTDYQGEGMYTEQALNNLVKSGTVKLNEFDTTFSTYPEIKTELDKVKNDLLLKAEPNRVSAYYEIKKNNGLEYFIEDIKYALINNYEVYITVDIYSSFDEAWRNDKGNIPNADKVNEVNRGGHCMCIVGWDKYNRIIIANSWGANGGDNGYCYIPFTSNIVKRIYVVIDKIQDNKIKNLKYINVMQTNEFDNKEDAIKKYNKYQILGFMKDCKIINSENKWYLYYGEIYDTRQEAQEYKNKSNFKSGLIIKPIVIQEYKIYFPWDFSKDIVEKYINEKVFGDYDYFLYTKNEKHYIGLKFEIKELCDVALEKFKEVYGIQKDLFINIEE